MAMTVYIQIDKKEWKPGVFMIPIEYKHLSDKFAEYMAKTMAEEVQKAIRRQRYSSKWAPLTISYKIYKTTHNLSTNTWEATGTLRKSITYWKKGDQYIIGIPPRKIYHKSGIPVMTVAKYLEYGTSKMPPRPLFRPIASYLQKNIRRYWEKFFKHLPDADKKGVKATR
ncbi:hypothetical protein HSE3_gp069 [Bacillus phage vB_BceM-HSE3]|nr:hypothetical protein HSE3_gp069 [Bacillus phage vB_BceM-HSE3]